MKRLLITTGIAMLVAGNAFAADVQYNMRVDGITCPFCVATSAKALKKIDGVKKVSSDLENGIIKVCADENVKFTDEQLTKLFVEKGFTYRSMEKQKQCDPA
ncbi:MAG: cation transporter [Robiginitomaculum sp.]|nr:cation transporter [Robiginitomaculum sp.]